MAKDREKRLAGLTRALTALSDNALLDAWKAAVAIRHAARAARNGDEAGLRAAICEGVAERRFGQGKHTRAYEARYSASPHQ